jgi:hypothetical protein
LLAVHSDALQADPQAYPQGGQQDDYLAVHSTADHSWPAAASYLVAHC